MDWLAKLVSCKTPRMDAFYTKRRAETEENNRLVRQLSGFGPNPAARQPKPASPAPLPDSLPPMPAAPE